MNNKHFKYPRTMHMPFSEGATNDDKVLSSLDHFIGKGVVITEKMDGENSTLYNDYSHARSLDSKNHKSRNLLKNFHSQIKDNIPSGWRVCGENMYAKHSIHYNNLDHHFLGFSIWNSDNVCLSWDDTMEWFSLIGIVPVPVIWSGVYDESKVKEIIGRMDLNNQEGIVMRMKSEFHYDNFMWSVAKFVRKGHVHTNKHWKDSKIIPNTFKINSLT